MDWKEVQKEFTEIFRETIGEAVELYGLASVRDMEELAIDFFEETRLAAGGDDEAKENLRHLLGELKIIGATAEGMAIIAAWDFVGELGKKGLGIAAAFLASMLVAI